MGPFERALRTYGRVKGLALGAFGDLSEEWDVLLGFIAKKWAVKQRRQSGYMQVGFGDRDGSFRTCSPQVAFSAEP